MNFLTVRGKIILNSALILGIMALATLYTSLATAELARSVELLFRNNLELQTISQDLDRTEASLAAYLRTKSTEALKDFIMYSTRLAEGARDLNHEIRDNQILLYQRDLAALVGDYLEDAEAAVKAKRGRDVQVYAAWYDSSRSTAGHIRNFAGMIEDAYLRDSLGAWSRFNSRIPPMLSLNALLVAAAALTGFMMLLRFSWKLTDPLIQLARAARAVGQGDLLASLPLPESDDEIGTTARAFMAMQGSIHQAFEELKAKAELEKNLLEERMRILDMDHRLKDAELLALQTQINPHFLFNTLAAGMQLALSENAERSAEFMDNLASFIRYALRSPSRLVRVAEEIENVERYIWLLRLRFGERYRFTVTASPECLERATPALILQPLVENSVAHGLKDREAGGEIRVAVYCTAAGGPGGVTGQPGSDPGQTGPGSAAGALVLEVSDTGDGMDQAMIDRILDEAAHGDMLQDGGIGLRNVIRRISLAGNGTVSIDSDPPRLTTVRIRIPGGS